MYKLCDHLTHGISWLSSLGVWSFTGSVIWIILVTQLSHLLKIEKAGWLFASFLLSSLAPSFPSLLPSLFPPLTLFHSEIQICCPVVCVLLLSFWSGISQPVLLSWNRRESSCSKQEQQSLRWQNSGNASLFWLDSDWTTGLKHSRYHEDTQVWGAWCESVWLHSPRMGKIQPHIQVTLLHTFPPIPKHRNTTVYFTEHFLGAWPLSDLIYSILPTTLGCRHHRWDHLKHRDTETKGYLPSSGPTSRLRIGS